MTPRPCRYCQAPILWLEKEPQKWRAINPQGEFHSCLGTIAPKKRKTHGFKADKSKRAS